VFSKVSRNGVGRGESIAHGGHKRVPGTFGKGVELSHETSRGRGRREGHHELTFGPSKSDLAFLDEEIGGLKL